jgi:hypothetical protein
LVKVDLTIEAAGTCEDREKLLLFFSSDLISAGKVAATAGAEKLGRRKWLVVLSSIRTWRKR